MWQFPAVAIARNGDSRARSCRRFGQSFRQRCCGWRRKPTRRALAHFSGIPNQPLTPLPVAAHSVTFRKITLAPFLARVARLPKRPQLPHFAARETGAASHIERDAKNRPRCNRRTSPVTRSLPRDSTSNFARRCNVKIGGWPTPLSITPVVKAEPLPVIQRYFEVSLFLLVTTGILALVATGKLDVVSPLRRWPRSLAKAGASRAVADLN